MKRPVAILKQSALAVSLLTLTACEQGTAEAPQSQPRVATALSVPETQAARSTLDVEEHILLPEANFFVRDHSACVASIQGALVAQHESYWSHDEVDDLCNDIAAVTDPSTLTVITFAGTSTLLEDGQADANWFWGKTTDNLHEYTAWAEATSATDAVWTCLRDAMQTFRREPTLEDGFATQRVEETAGLPFPEPLSSVEDASTAIESLGESVLDVGAAVAFHEVPGEGMAVALLGGEFYAQPQLNYAAFMGCGALVAIEENTGAQVHQEPCLITLI